jgi:hypothetical protein
MVINDMKKTILTLALVAGLTSFAGSAKAALVTANLNQFTDGSSFIGFGYNGGAINSNSSDGIYGSWSPSGRGPAYGRIGINNTPSAGDGYYVGSNTPLQYGDLINELVSYQTSSPTSIEVNQSTGGYWAVKFNAGGGNFNYGWVEVDVTSSGMTFGMAGVETTPNVAITAGAVPIPELGTWAAMAIFAGGAAYAGWRRRKSAKVSE